MTSSFGRIATLLNTRTRVLSKSGFQYLLKNRKGRMSIADLKNHLKIEKSIRREYPWGIRILDICFYLDGKSFICQSNPNDQF